ncbi:UNVERIFIED_CONTAM: hypothetical protein FKN15_066597 [Acipenser sinensis]
MRVPIKSNVAVCWCDDSIPCCVCWGSTDRHEQSKTSMFHWILTTPEIQSFGTGAAFDFLHP